MSRVDMFINNIIYRQLELQHIYCYDMIANYELKKLTRKKIESENIDINSEKTFNLANEHPSHKYMVMSQRNKIIIPCISSINLLPNIADLRLDLENADYKTDDAR